MSAETKRKLSRRAKAVIAVIAALAIMFSGTLAWQSISQRAQNLMVTEITPGGRLHDDFSGPNGTKDVYVENYGTKNIYARVRLDEYMEVGDGAGKYTVTEAGGTTTITRNAENEAVSLVDGAAYEDETTWTTHIPGTGELGEGTEQGFSNSDETFHKYWKWSFGGSTTYMPTFNKDNTSIAADINGTYAGKEGTTGHYDDYVNYNTDDYKTTGKTGTATYAPETEGGESVTMNETHIAKKTLTASVITMATYNSYPNTSDEEGVTTKKNFVGWVYDADGWAYWSQAIEPGTATGLLLDKVENATGNGRQLIPPKNSFYAINVIGEFVTADDIGSAEKGDGFYSNGSTLPSLDALALLEGIGVEIGNVTISKVEGSTSTDITDQVLTMLEEAAGTSFTTAAAISTPVDGATWNWTSSDSSIVTVTANESDSSQATVAVVTGNTQLGAITITANYTDPNGAVFASASFIANVPKTLKVGQTVTLDKVTYTVMAIKTVTGRSATETEATQHSAALLLCNNVFGGKGYGPTNNWENSTVRSYLKTTYTTDHPEAAANALEVTIATYDVSDTEDHKSETTDTFFPLSEADVTGKATNGSVGNATPEDWEYTAGAKLPTLKAIGDSSYIYHAWLRTPDRANTSYSLYIQNATTGTVLRATSGTIIVNSPVKGTIFIRPAFWYNLDAVSTGN